MSVCMAVDTDTKARASRRCVAAAVALAAAGACVPTVDAGHLGTLRYAERVKGVPPLNLLPPVADPQGNVYVLNGAPNLPETHAFVGFVGGGWGSACNLTKGDKFGAHGWLGFAATRQWYWSGAAIVGVSGTDGRCHAVLDHDPSTGADLLFVAAMPGVRNLSERTTVVALVQASDESVPFSALVDLDAEFLTNVTPFQPGDATDITVVGVGGSREQQVGVVLVQYVQGGAPRVEARFFDGDANQVAVAPIGGGPFTPYGVQGYLELDPSGRVAGLVAAGDGSLGLLTFDRGGGAVAPVSGMDPVGVHLWGGRLWLVGTAGSGPAIAPIDARGGVGAAVVWSSSLAAANALGPTTQVRDDRSLPSRETAWTGVKSAMGSFPFLHAHALTQHAPDTTLWLFAGPTTYGAAAPLTSIAMAPVGVTYP